MQVLLHGKVVGTSQKWPAKAGGCSPKGPAVAGTTVYGKHCCAPECNSGSTVTDWEQRVGSISKTDD